jgi:flavin reductase (DIM6/NTAB) family NADH-FMN oxidoreductase RutF
VQWDGIAVREDERRFLQGAVGWLVVRTIERFDAGDHVIFLGATQSLEAGTGSGGLVYVDRRYVPL